VIGEWLTAFLLTQTVELPVHANAPGLDKPLRERVAIGFGASAITHPAVWFIIPPLMSQPLVRDLITTGDWRRDWWITVAVAELFAFGTEALWLMAFGVRPRWALATSLLANAFSFTLGLFCYRLLGW
jgi:hypothetical protein